MSKKDYIQNIEGAERRYFSNPAKIQKRTEGDTEEVVIEGYAALFNKRTHLGWMQEEIMPGAFDNVMNDDVRCLFNHDPNLVLARSVGGKGTLQLTVDSEGLKYRYTTPDRTFAKDLADAIEAGDVSQSSFAFRAKKVIWIEGGEDEADLRQIIEMDKLVDVSPVTYPAYTDTTVAKRSFDAEKQDTEEEKKKDPEQRAKGNENSESLDEFEAQFMYNKNKQLK